MRIVFWGTIKKNQPGNIEEEEEEEEENDLDPGCVHSGGDSSPVHHRTPPREHPGHRYCPVPKPLEPDEGEQDGSEQAILDNPVNIPALDPNLDQEQTSILFALQKRKASCFFATITFAMIFTYLFWQ